MKTGKKILVMAMVGVLCFSSCRKERNREFDHQVMEDEILSSETTALFEGEEMYASLDCDYDWGDLYTGPCATITQSSEEFPKTITIDFGDGCEYTEGRMKKGKIIINVSNDMRTEGAIRTVTFEDFFIEEVAVIGERRVENIGLSASGNPLFSVTSSMSFERDDITRTRTINHQREWINGSVTCEFSDDEFLITGTGETVGINDRSGTHEIITPLHVFPANCRHILSGKIEIKTTKKRGGTIDYGTGGCDNQATLTTFKGDVYEIDLTTRRIVE